MKPFRERNPVAIGVAGLVVIAALLLGAFNAGDLPFLSDANEYAARFREAAGIERDNEVRVAGIRVGQVTGVSLDGDRVVVRFDVDRDVRLGSQTRAAIKLKTLLGTKYLELTPAGDGSLEPGATIPDTRTEVPFQIYEAFDELSDTLDEIDTERLGRSLQVLADTFRDPHDRTSEALRGLSRLSRTIASRDAELRRLLASTRTVTAALAERDVELTRLLGDADLVLQMLQQRRQVIHDLLRDTDLLARELTSLVRVNRRHLDPLLSNLHAVVEVLRSNLASVDRSVEMLGPFARYGASATGNGRWLDVYAENLVISDEILCALGACE